MKVYRFLSSKLPRKYITIFTFLFGIVLLFESCTKKNEWVGGPVTYASFFNAVARNNSVDFFINNQMVNLKSLVFGESLGYFNVGPGAAKLDITFGTVQVVASDNTTFDEGKYYSIFVTGKSPIDFIVTDDARTDPPAGQAKVRFVQLSPDAPNINIDIEDKPNLFADRTYKSYTDFIVIDAGNYNLRVRQAGSNTVKFSKFDVQIDGGGIYTIVAIGLWSGTVTEPPLDIKIIKNK
jgi:hypothetical protein